MAGKPTELGLELIGHDEFAVGRVAIDIPYLDLLDLLPTTSVTATVSSKRGVGAKNKNILRRVAAIPLLEDVSLAVLRGGIVIEGDFLRLHWGCQRQQTPGDQQADHGA